MVRRPYLCRKIGLIKPDGKDKSEATVYSEPPVERMILVGVRPAKWYLNFLPAVEQRQS